MVSGWGNGKELEAKKDEGISRDKHVTRVASTQPDLKNRDHYSRSGRKGKDKGQHAYGPKVQMCMWLFVHLVVAPSQTCKQHSNTEPVFVLKRKRRVDKNRK